VAGEAVGTIDGPGLCVLLGVARTDDDRGARAMAAKLWRLRILADAAGTMNVAAADIDAPLLVISQFTLLGDTSRGRRPSWQDAAPGPEAAALLDVVVAELRAMGATVATGRFGADMQVELVNDGPVTVIVETR
jgi:D-aminoacyl-tRNA deacylase